MKKKILYILFAIILVAAIVMTFVKGARVSLYYGEGETISFTEQDTIEVKDIEKIVQGIWGKDYIVQKLEFFNDSAEIKVKSASDEQLKKLCDELNKKYNSKLEVSSFKVEHVSNQKIRSLFEPYIIPVCLSMVIIVIYYAVRYNGTKQMRGLIGALVVVFGLLYSAYMICRIPVNTLMMPIMVSAYLLTILGYTIRSEYSIIKENLQK